MSLFDDCFQTYPHWNECPGDWASFWKSSLTKLKRVPQELRSEVDKSLFFGENVVKLTFQGFDKYQLHATLYLPKRIRAKPPVVVVFPDYIASEKLYPGFLEERYAVLVPQLRGHDIEHKVLEKNNSEGLRGFGYFAENLREKENYYMKSLYLDAYRLIEVLRLNEHVDKSRIYFYGKGTGAAMALFVETFMPRAQAIALDCPSFINLPVTQNLSKAEYALEINSYIRKNPSRHNSIKKELGYFDALYFSNKIKPPLLMTLNLEDHENNPRGAFSLFHGLKGEKAMEIYPDTADYHESEKKKISKIVTFYNRYSG